jgi:hypothetical protein
MIAMYEWMIISSKQFAKKFANAEWWVAKLCVDIAHKKTTGLRTECFGAWRMREDS